MDKTKLKEILIAQIQHTEDEHMLREVYRLLEIDAEEVDPYTLNEEQKAAIKEARAQVKNGEFLTHEQAKKSMDEWLNRRSRNHSDELIISAN